MLSLDNTIYQNSDKGLYNFTFSIHSIHPRKVEFEFEMSMTHLVAIVLHLVVACHQ